MNIKETKDFLERLFPINRSITGNGNRQTLNILKEIIPIELLEFESSKQVFDWTIPEEWNVKNAWIKSPDGKKLIDIAECNIHLMSYSVPFSGKLSFEDLKKNLYFDEENPEEIPYRTSYYKRTWGFCISKKQYEKMSHMVGEFEVFIDSELNPKGSLTIGEFLVKGKSKEEVLVSTYLCHPSLANDNLSGVLLTALLAKEISLLSSKLNKTYRFIWVPETIGAITYCAHNESLMKSIDVGLVVTTVGGDGQFGYKQTFNKNHYLNSLIEDVFNECSQEFVTYPFDINGSDERQYSSQGFRINTATITKDKYYEYSQYHKASDNLDFVRPENLLKSLDLYEKLLKKIDLNIIYRNNLPNCEVMLSKYNLYPGIGGAHKPNENTEFDIRRWLLFYCDGTKDLVDISKEIGYTIEQLSLEAEMLVKEGIMSKKVSS